MIASKDDFLNLIKREYRQFEVVGFGEVRIRSLTEAERSKIIEKLIEDNAKAGEAEIPYVIAASVCDEDGDLYFCDEDIATIKSMNSSVLRAIYQQIDAAFGVSLTLESERVEETAKNLPEMVTADSS